LSDEELYNAEHMPSDYCSFINEIGWIVKVGSHNGFCGQLRNCLPPDCDETAPYFADFEIEVIFRVSTLMAMFRKPLVAPTTTAGSFFDGTRQTEPEAKIIYTRSLRKLSDTLAIRPLRDSDPLNALRRDNPLGKAQIIEPPVSGGDQRAETPPKKGNSWIRLRRRSGSSNAGDESLEQHLSSSRRRRSSSANSPSQMVTTSVTNTTQEVSVTTPAGNLQKTPLPPTPESPSEENPFSISARKKLITSCKVLIVWANLISQRSRLHLPQSIGSRALISIVIYPLKSGLFHMRIFKKASHPLGPLQDDMVVSKQILPYMVRQTAINACKILNDADAPKPFSMRKVILDEFIRGVKSDGTFMQFYSPHFNMN